MATVDVESALLDVDDDGVAGLQRADRSAVGRFRRDVADHEAVGGAGEAAVGHERNGFAQARTLDGAGDVQHLAHARSALRPFPADDDDVVRLDPPRLHRRERVLFTIEHARRPAMQIPLLARDLRHAAVGGKVAAEDDEPSFGLDRIRQRADHLLPGRLARRARFLTDRAAGDGDLVGMQEPGFEQPLGDDRHATRLVHLGRRVAPPRLHVGEQGRLA